MQNLIIVEAEFIIHKQKCLKSLPKFSPFPLKLHFLLKSLSLMKKSCNKLLNNHENVSPEISVCYVYISICVPLCCYLFSCILL